MEPRLQSQLSALESTLRRTRRLRQLTRCWAAAAVISLLLLLVCRVAGWNAHGYWLLPLAGGVIAVAIVRLRERRRPADLRALVTALEQDHPDLRHLLSAAVEQEPDPDSGTFKFLQLRVIDQVLTHRQKNLWEEKLERNLSSAGFKHAVALAGVLIVFCVGVSSTRWHSSAASWLAKEITVTPGDTEVERGTGLVITARFGSQPPPEATLVLISASGKTKRLPLQRHLADPVFGASLPEVTEDGLYRVEYGTKQTRDFKIAVFDYPALTRADAALQFPEYTGLTNKTIRDTRRVSAVEGSRLTYTLQLNKPVARARLLGKESRVAELTLSVSSNAVALLNDLTLTNSARYTLELVDGEGRTNKFPSDFAIQVLTNRRPELKLAFPRGDQRVSKLEEVQLQAEASDDFGLMKYGLGFGVAGQEPQLVELGQSATANEKRQFGQLISLEKLGVQVDQVVCYFAWADDHGPDGQVRRTFSDIFFAEVRPFEEIFRRDQSGGGGGGGQEENQNSRLTELQKQIVIATWKLEKGAPGAPHP